MCNEVAEEVTGEDLMSDFALPLNERKQRLLAVASSKSRGRRTREQGKLGLEGLGYRMPQISWSPNHPTLAKMSQQQECSTQSQEPSRRKTGSCEVFVAFLHLRKPNAQSLVLKVRTGRELCLMKSVVRLCRHGRSCVGKEDVRVTET